MYRMVENVKRRRGEMREMDKSISKWYEMKYNNKRHTLKHFMNFNAHHSYLIQFRIPFRFFFRTLTI